MFKKYFLAIFSAIALFSGSVHPIDVKYGTTPTIDGVFSPGEWSDADSANGQYGNWTFTVYYKHDTTSLLVALRGISPCNAPIVDVLHNHGYAPQPDDYRLHGSGSAVEFVGTGSGWSFADSVTGWDYVGNDEFSEFVIFYSKLDITPSIPKTIGFMCNIYDWMEGMEEGWPAGSNYLMPNSWVDMASSDNWETPKVIVSVEPDTIIGPPPDISDCFIDSIYITNADSLCSWQFALTFNPSVLHVTSITEGPFLQQSGDDTYFIPGEINNDSGYIAPTACTIIGPSLGAAGSGTLAYITWQVMGYGGSILDLEAVVDLCESVDGYFYLPEPKIEEKAQSDLNKLELQNYPNPFSSRVTVRYGIPKSGKVSLKVYDISGQLVKTLINEIKEAGHYYTNWYIKGMRGGIYFLQLKTQGKVTAKKLIIVK